MKVDLSQIDYGYGVLGLLVHSMIGQGSFTITFTDDEVLPISTRISPDAKKRLEQLSEIGGVSMSVITRLCIERGLNEITNLILEIKEAQAAADLEMEQQAFFDVEAHHAQAMDALSEFRKESGPRKATKK